MHFSLDERYHQYFMARIVSLTSTKILHFCTAKLKMNTEKRCGLMSDITNILYLISILN